MQTGLALEGARRWLLGLAVAMAFFVGGACGGDSKTLIDESCKVDTDCAGDTPYCDTAASTCVACLENSHCPSSSAPICELSNNTCRGCSADAECPSGVCMAASGTCAVPAQILYLNATTGLNNPNCSKEAPCKTMLHVKDLVNATRNVIRVIGPLNEQGNLQAKVHVDGDGSEWTFAGKVLGVTTSAAAVTVEGVTMRNVGGVAMEPVIQCSNMGSLRLHQVVVQGSSNQGEAVFSSCDTTITKSLINNTVGPGVLVRNRALTIEDSTLRDNMGYAIRTESSTVTLARNRISGAAPGATLAHLENAPALLLENNLVTSGSLTTTGVLVLNGPSAGQLRFNTLVNTALGARTSEGITCSGTSIITSNVIAWQYGAAQGVNACARRYNAVDSNTPVGNGEGNVSAALTALFVGSDTFSLAAGSPAHGLGEPGLKVATDLEGKPRPAEGRLDAGAFETP